MDNPNEWLSLFDLEPYTLPAPEPEPDGNRENVPNAVWGSDNELDIPLLDLRMCASALDMPLVQWGAKVSRKASRFGGTGAFYTDDYRFEAIWDRPWVPASVGFSTLIEPNYTCTEQMPVSLVQYFVYRKRWLARYWQSLGIKMVVDLNVAPRWYEMNLLGVPDGWTAFATRGYSEQMDCLEAEYTLAQKKAGDKTLLFLIYGGGKKVQAKARELGAIWVMDQRDQWKVRDGQ